MSKNIDRTEINSCCPICPLDSAHPHRWDAKRGGYICYQTDQVLGPEMLIRDPHDRRGVPQTERQTNIGIQNLYRSSGLPTYYSVIGRKQVEAMDGQLRDALILMWRDERGVAIRKGYFALNPDGRDWEYLGDWT